VSPQADSETIVGVSHARENASIRTISSGDTERFRLVMEAFHVLSDPERRSRYDARYERARERRWRVFDQQTQ